MTAAELLAGTALLALTTGSAGAFAAVAVRRWLGHLGGAPRLVAFALLGAFAFFAIHLAPGALGVLGKPGVAVSAAALTALCAVLRAPPTRDEREPPPAAPESTRFSWVLAVGALGVVSVYAIAHALAHGRDAVTSVDMTTFHLPNVARWIQSGSFWQDDEFVPFRSFGTYPNTGDVFTLGAILPFDNDFLVRLVGYPFLALTVLATWALARELRAPAASALLFAVGLVAMPVVMFPALEALPDAVMLASFSGGLLFVVRHRRTGRRADLVLAGVGLGLAAGTKWYAPVAVAVVLAAWLATGLLERRSPRAVLASVAVAGALVAAVSGFWLIRNAVEVGNPVFPVHVGVGDLTVFDAPHDLRRERLGFSLSDYLGRSDVWRDVLWPAFRHFMSPFAILLWLALPLAAVVAVLRRREAHARSILLCIAAAVGIGVLYLFLPYTAQGPEGRPVQAVANTRYVVPALVLAAVGAAWAAGRLGRAGRVLEAAAALLLLDALRRNADFSGGVELAAWAAAATAIAAFAASAQLVRARGIGPRAGTALAGYACAALAAGALLYAHEERFNEHRYASADDTARWVRENAPAGQRVGVAGEGFSVYPMFGPRLENEVEYIGPRVEGMLLPYERSAPFARAVRAGDYDLVLVQHAAFFVPGLPERHERVLLTLGYRRVAAAPADRKTLYERG